MSTQRPQQTQCVRINNNRFTAEDLDFQGGAGTFQGNFGNNFQQFGGQQRGNQVAEVIDRGGSGAWHGTMQSLFKDDALNSRNVFAASKPPYQERQVNVDVGGPVIPGRLTTNVNVGYSLAQQVDTINAILPEGPFALDHEAHGQPFLQLAQHPADRRRAFAGVRRAVLRRRSQGRRHRWIHVAGARLPPQRRTKNDRPSRVGRNSALAPKRINFDLNISKAFFMGSAGSAGTRKNVNLFANVTNMFNRVHYNNPSAVMSSEKFGQYTSASDPREVEVGLRFQF